MEELRIVLLGKTGVGKSATGNTILGQNVFKEERSQHRGIVFCQKEEKEINCRRIDVIDTPGLFDTDLTKEEVKEEIISILVECAPGPHVFLLVIKVDRYTQENQQTVEKLLEYFSGDVVHHMVLLFTHGDDLDENMTIHDFIKQSDVEGKKSGKQSLKDLVERCGNRVHVIDNKYWKENRRELSVLAQLQGLNLSDQDIREITEKTPADQTPWFKVLSDEADHVATEHGDESKEQSLREYRTNTYQLTQLMKSINTILRENKRHHYIIKTLEKIGEALNEEMRKKRWDSKDEGKSQSMVEPAFSSTRSALAGLFLAG